MVCSEKVVDCGKRVVENSDVTGTADEEVKSLVNSVGREVTVVSCSVESGSMGKCEDGTFVSVVCISETVVEKAFVDVTPGLEGLKVDGIKPSVVGGTSVEEENCDSVDTVDSEIGPNVVTVSVFKLLIVVVVKKSVDCSVPVNVVPSVTPWVAMDSVVGMKVGKSVED